MIDPARLAALLAACLVAAAASVPASADYLDIAQFALTEHDGGRFRLVATLSDAADTGLSPTWPRACTLRSRDASRLPNARRVAFDVDCPPASSADLRIEMPWGRDGAILELDRDDGVVESRMLPGGPTGSVIDLSERPPDAAGSSGGFWPTARRYLALGTEHVLIGWDHLAFVFCLGMLASGASLAWLISSFTLGHSVSLALAHYGVLRIPTGPVEALIALSVAFMAREALLHLRAGGAPGDARPSGESRRRVGVTAAFGLVHGLGFASVLGSLGVSPAQTATALAFFNIGVEAGQLLFVFSVLGLVLCLRKLRIDRVAVSAGTCFVGGLGVFWTVERIAGF